MSYEDYKIGFQVEMDFDSDQFYGVIQGAMRLADNDNLEKLKREWPEQWEELQARYHAPGGQLPND
jgi:hypothetical protein